MPYRSLVATFCSLLLLATGASAQDLSQKVTYSAPAGRAKFVIADLATKTWVRLEVAANEADDVIQIRVKGVSLKSLVDQLAVVTHAEWVRDRGVMRLTRSAKGNDAERRLDADDARMHYERSVAELAKKAAALPELGSVQMKSLAAQLLEIKRTPLLPGNVMPQGMYSRIQTGQSQTPSGRLMTRMMGLLDAKSLADLPIGMKVVFATDPHPSQRAFPVSIQPALTAFLTEQTTWSKIVEQTLASPVDMPSVQFSIPGFDRHQAPSGNVRVLLSLGRDVFGRGVEAWLNVFNGDGVAIGMANANIEWDPSVGAMHENAEVSAKVIDYRPISREVQSLFQPKAGPASAEVLDALTKPEAGDPLSLATSDALATLAEAKGLNLVACLPDAAFLVSSSQLPVPSVGDLAALAQNALIRWDENSGYLRVVPTTPAACRAAQVSREEAGKYLRACVSAKRVALDDLAAYAVATPPAMWKDRIGLRISAGLFPGLKSAVLSNDLQGLRIYGAMDSTQKAAAKAGQPIAISALNAVQRSSLDKLVYGVYGFPSTGSQLRQSNGPRKPFRDPYFSIEGQSTEAMPNGYAPDAVLEVKLTDEAIVAAAEGSDRRELTAEDIAYGRFRTEAKLVVTPLPPLEKVFSGRRQSITFTFFYTEMRLGWVAVGATAMAPDPVSFDALPKDFLQSIDYLYKRYQDMEKQQRRLMNGNGNGGKGTIPPRATPARA